MADIVAQIAKKGSLVFVQGEMQQNKPYTNKDGVQVQSYSLVVDTIRLCGGGVAGAPNGEASGSGNRQRSSYENEAMHSERRNSNEANQHYPQSGRANLASNTYETTQQQPQVQHQVNGNNDDDIPF